MRRTKADVERYISTVQSASPYQKASPVKGFLFAKLYFEAKEYELAKRHVSEYLTIQPKDSKAHKFLGQLFERDGETDKAVGCYKRSLDLNPAQSDLVLKVAELLCSKPDHDSRAEFWVEKAARLLPGNPTVFNLREKLLSAQSGSNQLYELLQSELKLRPADTYINNKLLQLYREEGRLEDAIKHCLDVEKAGVLRDCLEWYELLVSTLQEYLSQPSVSSNQQASRKFHKELLLAQCNRVRLTLALKDCEESTAALWSFDCAMQALKKTATNTVDELAEVFTEMRAHLYLYAGTLLLKRAQDGAQQWRAVVDLATLCYLISCQSPKPKAKSFKGEQVSHEPLELLACDRQSQAGHMLLNLSRDVEQQLKDVVEVFGNRSGPSRLFDELFDSQMQKQLSFICNNDIHILSEHPPKATDLAKWDSGAVLLHAGDLQHLAWLGLQWALMGQSASLQDWLKQLFPRLTLETSKLDTNAPESICLLDLEVFVSGVVFCSQTQLQEKEKMSSCSQPHEPRCLPLHIMKQLLSDRQREWWDAAYSLIYKRALPGTSAKLRLVIELGLSTLRAGEKHGLQPALLIHWAKHLFNAVERVNHNDQKDYAGRSVHYWKVVLPLMEKVRHKHSIPEPLQPLFMHFRSKDIQPSQVRVYEEDADISFATLLDFEGNTEQAIMRLEKLNSILSIWHLTKIYQRLSVEEENRLEETQGRHTSYLQMSRKYLTKIYQANAEDMEKLPVPMEEVMDSLNEVNQQLEDTGEMDEDQVDYPLTSSTGQCTKGHVKFSPPSLLRSVTSPYKRSVFSPTKPPHWAKGQMSMLQMLCQQVKALQNEVYDLRHNSSHATPSSYRMHRDNYAAEGLQETFPAAKTSHGVPLTGHHSCYLSTTGPSVYYNQSPAHNSQYFQHTAANVTPTKGPVYGMNRLPPQQHMYTYQQSTHTPPLQSTPACIYPQEQVFGPPIRFESPATSLLSPYSEEYYGHSVPQPTVNPTLPEPGYFNKQCAVTSTQPSRSTESKAVDSKMSLGSQFTGEPAKVPNFGEAAAAQTTTATAAFKFNSNFKSNDGDFPFSSAQVKNSESLLGLQTQEQLPSQSGLFIFGSKNATGFTCTDGAQNKINIFGNTDQRFSCTSATEPILGNSEAQEVKNRESDDDSTHVEEDEDGPHFEPIVPLPDKVDVKTGEEEEEEMFCKRAKLFRFDSETKEWKERGIGSVKILKHKISGKVRLLMRREQVLKICANHYITANMALKPNAGSDRSWVWYAMDYADEMPKTEQLAIRFKMADEAALFKVKFEEAQKFLSESPQGQQTEIKSEMPQPQVSSKKADLKTLFSKKEGEWDCDVCCVRNAPISAVCVACGSAAPSSAQVKPREELKGSVPVAPPPKLFSFGLPGDSAKNTVSTDASSKAFTFGPQAPVSFKFGSKDAAVTTDGFGAPAEKKTIQAEAPQQEKVSTTPAVPFGSGFGAQFAKKEGQWDCDSCLVRTDASATECVCCKAASQKDGEWDCDTCLVRNKSSFSHCVSCQTANPNMKNKTSAAPSSSSFTFSSGSSSSQPAATGFKANFNPGIASQFGTRKEETSSEGSKLKYSITEAEKSSSSSSISFSMPAPVGGFKFGIAESEAEPSDRQSQSGSGSDLFKNIAELHKEKEKEAAPSSSDQPLHADSQDNNPLFTGKPNSFAELGKSQSFQFGQKDPNFRGFAGAGGQLFKGLQSSPKADISVDQDDEIYKTKENDDIQFEPVVPLPDSVEVSTGEGKEEVLSSHQAKLHHNDKYLIQTPGAKLGTQSTNTEVSPPKFAYGSDSVQKIFGSLSPSKEKSKDEEMAVSRLKTTASQFGTRKEEASSEGLKIESSTIEAEKSSSSSSFSFSVPTPVDRFKFGIAESEAEPSDRQSQSGSASDLLKNIAELHKEKEKEAAPSSSDQSVDADSQDNNPLLTGKPNSFAELGKSQSFQFGQKDPNFRGFAGAGEQLFKGLQSSPKDKDEMYKIKENDDIQFETVVPLPDSVEVSTGERNEEVLSSHQAKLHRNDKSKDEETAVSRMKTSAPVVTSKPSVVTSFSIPAKSLDFKIFKNNPIVFCTSATQFKARETTYSAVKIFLPPPFTFFAYLSHLKDPDHQTNMLVFADSEVSLKREKRSTANEEQRASSDSEEEAEKPDDLNTEIKKPQEAQVMCLSLGFTSAGLSFAELAKGTGELTFDKKGGQVQEPQSLEAQQHKTKERNHAMKQKRSAVMRRPHNDEIHSDPLISLPEVEVK
ncbi:hypothetical protein Q8A67_007327 [Cirrhinus molitorella]|uniref:Uncharacterized protein n=1 Tax=Cirrhinus molitorella TaxID=172907 RepID=A0AA88Q0B7_9TELE|nr:hypothetical protein Q8A67_007327 [Cirrhinus molitorella]